MRRFSVALCVAVMLGGGALLLAGDQDFKLVNKTGVTITHVYLSPANSSQWGEDVMGKDNLGNGDSVDIAFHRSEKECIWDLKVTDKEGDDIVWEDINLCKAEQITLKYEGKHPTAIIK
jgi:hypothetical protein